MNTLGIGVLIIGAVTYLSVAAALAFRNFGQKSNADFRDIHHMADPMLNVVVTLFSILLGFLVADAMERYSNTQVQCETEALKLVDIYSLARGMDDAHRLPLQAACVTYCNAVMNDEWPLMAHHKTSPIVWQASRNIWDLALAYPPKGDRQTDIHQSLIDAVRDLGESRRSRIVALRGRLSPALWIVVIGGSIILMACTYMFFIENPKLQGLMIALVALSLALNVSLLAIYSSPFEGDLKIQPEAFDLDAQSFKIMQNQPSLPGANNNDDDDDKDDAKGKGASDDKEKDKDKDKDKDKVEVKGKEPSNGKELRQENDKNKDNSKDNSKSNVKGDDD